jgi:NAD(P)-dependent dehydrogenase (short-subunit alcohol dehydrogenase family)/ketosteroid isomerase-like protein
MSEANRALIRRFTEAFDAGDGETMAACYAPHARFRDPAFGELTGEQAGDMWRMLTDGEGALRVELAEHHADATAGAAHWIARYTVTQTGRPVVNDIHARFRFADGLFVEHLDEFSFFAWSRQALGPIGLALGWTPQLPALLRRRTRAMVVAGPRRAPTCRWRDDWPMTGRWSADQIADQTGRTAVVTGANSGLGLVTAHELARAGATVVLACRNVQKGEAAAAEIGGALPGARLKVAELDLSSLESVRRFAGALEGDELALLINNAGIMMTPQQETADGFELQFGTNHLGHFALTGLLLERLGRAQDARVVTLSSLEHKAGHIHFDDLRLEHGYAPRKAYRQSKLANASFGLELDRRLRAAGSPVKSLLAHPGYSATNLQSTGPTGIMKALLSVGNRVLAQNAEQGALPTLYAATAADVESGKYYGPDGFQEMRGRPTEVKVIAEGRDPDVGRTLWEVSEELTGVEYGLSSTVVS